MTTLNDPRYVICICPGCGWTGPKRPLEDADDYASHSFCDECGYEVTGAPYRLPTPSELLSGSAGGGWSHVNLGVLVPALVRMLGQDKLATTARNPSLAVDLGVDPLRHALSMARIALKFGQVRRVTMHEDGEPESDTTHTVMLVLLAIDLAPMVGCDPGLSAQFAAVHDLPEVYANDTNTAHEVSAEQAAEKMRREAAERRLAAELGDASTVLSLVRRYERQREPEARFVRYLDKVTPKLTNSINGGAALAALGLTVEDVAKKHALQRAQLDQQYPEMTAVRDLFNAACALVEQRQSEVSRG